MALIFVILFAAGITASIALHYGIKAIRKFSDWYEG